jgi:hypothetical protein
MEKVIFVMAAVICLGLVGSIDFDEATKEEATYCRMVDMHNDSNGVNGWPDYNRNYKEICK